jgi:hypothetical protein
MADLEPRSAGDVSSNELARSETAQTQPAGAASAGARPTRRALIASIAGLVGAAMAKTLARPGTSEAQQGVCGPLASDCFNEVTATTYVDRTLAPLPQTGPVVQVDTAQSTAVQASTGSGVALVGRAGVDGGFTGATMTYSTGGLGVSRVDGAGLIGMTVVATSTINDLRTQSAAGGIGVLGLQGEAISIFGPTHTINPNLHGAVVGLTRQGTGVLGASATATGVAVLAYNSSGGYALQVAGAAAFSTIGQGVIPVKVLEHDVQDTSVGENSHIMVTFNSPAKKLFVSWVEITAGFGFRLHLSKKQNVPVSFTYLVLERAASSGTGAP